MALNLPDEGVPVGKEEGWRVGIPVGTCSKQPDTGHSGGRLGLVSPGDVIMSRRWL